MSIDDIFRELSDDQILFRDEVLIAVHKPAGLSTASSDGADDLVGRVRRFLASERGIRADAIYVGVQEHLERDASGIVLFTLDKRANRGLAAQLERGTAERSFLVITTRDSSPRLIATTRQRSTALRKELANQGTPVVGDVHHGGPAAHRAMCHARAITIDHPITGSALRVECAVPASLQGLAESAPSLMEHASCRDALFREAFSKRCPIVRGGTSGTTTAVRLLSGAADGFEGIAVDLYDHWLVAHIFDDAWLPHAESLARALQDATECTGVYLKRHPRQKNELAAEEIASLAGERALLGVDAPDPLRIFENAVPLDVRLGDGLRTGLFLDQRNNRDHVRRQAPGKRVLNLFAYTCGFSVAALAGGAAEVTSVDASALVMSRANAVLAELGTTERHRAIVGDCFDVLAKLKTAGERFDLLIVDPPSYASTPSGRFKLRRDYPDLVANTAAIASPGASLLCCTNHHGTTDRDLRALVLQGAQQARREVRHCRIAPPPLDFTPAVGTTAELKSVWLELA